MTEENEKTYTEKTADASKRYAVGITGEYEAFRELICPTMTNPSSPRDVYCRGPRCGHWNNRLKMCGTASLGELAWTHLEYHKDYKATIELYQKKEENAITVLRAKLEKYKDLANNLLDELEYADFDEIAQVLKEIAGKEEPEKEANTLKEINTFAIEAKKHLDNADDSEEECMGYMGYIVWALEEIEKIIKLTEKEKEEKKDDQETTV